MSTVAGSMAGDGGVFLGFGNTGGIDPAIVQAANVIRGVAVRSGGDVIAARCLDRPRRRWEVVVVDSWALVFWAN